MTPQLKVSKLFFDKAAVKSAMTKDESKRLSKAGAFVWKREKSMLRYTKEKAAAPGEPPRVHKFGGFEKKKTDKKTGAVKSQPASPLKELNYFYYDPKTRSVVVGPVPFGKLREAPKLLEFGGTATRTRRRKLSRSGSKSGISAAAKAAARAKFLAGEIDGAPKQTEKRETYQANYAKRPWMGPALAKEIEAGKIPALWKNCIRGNG